VTPELRDARLGKITASAAGVVMGGLNTDGLSTYIRRLAGERVFGDLGEEGYASAWMRRGNELENPALDYFEYISDVVVERQAHIDHPTIPYVAATPDGLVRGLYTVEAKSPKFHVWAETREAWQNGKRGLAAVPSEYRHQCRWQPWCCELREGRFVSYHPVGGGQAVIVPYEITDTECEAMAERSELVNRLVNNWVEIFSERIA
jgi:exodeoxyribonuclease (lambda-induced)